MNPKTRSFLALAAGLVAAQSPGLRAHAATRLSEAEMAQVHGRDGSIALVALPAAGQQGDLGAPDGAVFIDPRAAAMLDPPQFAAALADAGLDAALIPGWDGQAVRQFRIDAAPVSFSFDASDLLLSTTGLRYAGPSMGTFTMTDFDARGTTVWTWNHH